MRSVVYMSFYDVHPLTYHITGIENPRDLLKPENVELVKPFLYENGFDTTKQIAVQACKHRSIAQGVVVYYRFIGWQRKDQQWRNDRRSTLHHQQDKDTWAEQQYDPMEGALEHEVKDLTNSWVSETYKEDREMIRALTELQRAFRGRIDDLF